MSWQRSQYLVLAAVVAALALAGCGGAGEATKSTTGDISGTVRDGQTLAAIADATVTLPPTTATATTSSETGAFALRQIRPGTYIVAAAADGYTYGSATVTVTAGAVVGATIIVYPASPALTVGASGATIQDTGRDGEEAECVIPAGALAQDTDIALTALCTSEAPPSPNEDASHVAALFTPDGQTFAVAVTVTVPTPGAMTPGSSVGLFEWDAGAAAWEAAGTATVGAGGVTASASVTNFCVYAAIEQQAVTSWSSVGTAAVQIHEVVVQSFVMTDSATVSDMYDIALASEVTVVNGAIYWLKYAERTKYPDDPERGRIDEIIALLEEAVAHNQGGGGGG